jgi:branched-chain amino acid transport system ATP-binding protein
MSDTTMGSFRAGLLSALPAAPQRERDTEIARQPAAGATPGQPDAVDNREILLEAVGLHTYYGSSHILHGVNFRIRKGEALGLMGRNGMGKTTLIRTMMGFLTPKAGSVQVRGKPLTGGPTHKIARLGIAYVPEGRGIFPNLTVRENLIMAARAGVEGQRDWTLERVMETFPRLAERIEYGGGNLSGGEQQMLTIGRALMTNPDLLILDEATEGLAPLIVREIWRVIREIRDSGIATVIVDKNHAAITALTDRSMILVKGQVVFDGPSLDVRNNPELIKKHLGV